MRGSTTAAGGSSVAKATPLLCTELRGEMKGSTRERIDGLVMASPWLIGFFVFVLSPTVRTFIFSFQEYDIIHPPVWVGLNNYRRLFSDEVFGTSMYNTAYYSLVSVPLQLLFALFLAFLMGRRIVLKTLITSIYFLPSVITGVAVALIWKLMFQGSYGVLNTLLGYVGITGPVWLDSPEWAKVALVILSLSRIGTFMIIYMAAIQGVPRDLYDAAQIDGAGQVRQFTRITVPIITPAIFFTLIIGFIYSFQIFTEVMSLTINFVGGPGGPARSTLMLVVYLYQEAFTFLRMGYAATLAWVLLIMVLFLTAVNFWLGKRWVHYEQ